MKWRRMVSDSEYIARIERGIRWRKPVACFVAVAAAVHTGVVGYLFYLVRTGTMPAFFDEPAQKAFQMGAVIGFFAGKSGFFALTALLIACVFWFSKPRKDTLLVKYHQRLIELGQLPE